MFWKLPFHTVCGAVRRLSVEVTLRKTGKKEESIYTYNCLSPRAINGLQRPPDCHAVCVLCMLCVLLPPGCTVHSNVKNVILRITISVRRGDPALHYYPDRRREGRVFMQRRPIQTRRQNASRAFCRDEASKHSRHFNLAYWAALGLLL